MEILPSSSEAFTIYFTLSFKIVRQVKWNIYFSFLALKPLRVSEIFLFLCPFVVFVTNGVTMSDLINLWGQSLQMIGAFTCSRLRLFFNVGTLKSAQSLEKQGNKESNKGQKNSGISCQFSCVSSQRNSDKLINSSLVLFWWFFPVHVSN